MIDNGNLVKKVAFPREILPLSVVGVALVDFALQSVVLLIFVIASGSGFHVDALVLYPLSFVTLVVFTTAMTFWVSASERPLSRRPTPDRAGAPRVVLDDADRVPGRARCRTS